MTLPTAATPFVTFGQRLRRHGFAIAPEQLKTFLNAITLLGPRSMTDIHQAALATLAPAPTRQPEFNAHFRTHFYGEAGATTQGEDDEETKVHDDGTPRQVEVATLQKQDGGTLTSARELLGVRSFTTETALQNFTRALPKSLPQRRLFRDKPSANGTLDLRRALRDITRTDGDLPHPPLRRRPQTPRKLLLLIDISGSMKLHTTDYLTVAHAAAQSCPRIEIFTLGTRLTRVTAALKRHDRSRALAQAAAQVADWDGGTRIGPTLLALLAIPRFAAFSRGAAVVILSDALERGDPADMQTAIRRLSHRAHRLSLCTPLAADPRFRPETAALRAILPMLDDLVDAASIAALTQFLLDLGHPAPRAETIWRNP